MVHRFGPSDNGLAPEIDPGQHVKPAAPEGEVADDNGPAGRSPFHLTDRGNAERLARAHGCGLRYVRGWGRWLRYDGRRWAHAEPVEVRALAAGVVRDLLVFATEKIRELADGDPDDEGRKSRLRALQKLQAHALRSESARSLNAMVDLLKSEPGLLIGPELLDTHRWAFNCSNGVLDLRTGAVRPHRPLDYLTAACPTRYAAGAPCPAWTRFLEEVFGGDAELIAYVQRLFGYALSGDVSAHMLPVLWGGGGNGKSTLLGAVLHAVGGDYATVANADFLLARRGERHPTEIADLFGRRLVSCQETGEGGGLNEALVKWLTGGDIITARRMREDYWSFAPTHKLFLTSNYKPAVKGTDAGIWRRLRLVPFTRSFDGAAEDRGLPGRLRGEAEGILAWLVEGCLSWVRDGERPPAAVQVATAEYRSEQDTVGQFVAERCERVAGARVAARDLYRAFEAWSRAGGERHVLTQTAFGSRIAAMGFEKGTSNGVYRVGLRLKLPDLDGLEQLSPSAGLSPPGEFDFPG